MFLAVMAGSILAISSCKDYLEIDNPSTTTEQATFNSVSFATSAVVGIYSRLSGDNGYGSRISTLFPQSADDFKTSGDYNPADRRGISTYGASSANTDLKEPFNQLYEGIERANICIKNIPLSQKYLGGTSDEQKAMKKLYGEALTLRAQFYYELIRNWGDVPAPFQPAADLTDIYLPATNRDTVYDHLISDLKIAEDIVPWRSETTDNSPARITKGFVKGLRARIALTRGGYSLRWNKMERRADYLDYYKIALKECEEIIASKEHGLTESYENLFKAIHTSKTLDANRELMFVVGAFGGNSKTDSKLAFYNGLKIDKESKFGQAGGGVVILPTYYYEFDATGKDSRRDVTIASFQIDKNGNKILSAPTDMTDGKFRRTWTGIYGSSQNVGVDWPIMRYADILLMYAEAANEISGGPTAAAIDAVNQVRRRAFGVKDNSYDLTATDVAGKDAFFNAIVKERLLEFGGEGIRKYDLIRWNLLGTKIAETREKLKRFQNSAGEYANVPQVVYVKASAFSNTGASDELKSLDIYGGTLNEVANRREGAAPDSKLSYTKRNWALSVDAAYVSLDEKDKKGYAFKFKENQSELFPFYFEVLSRNTKVVQNFGY